MAHVVVLDSINEDIFVCGYCKLVFNSLQLFVDHKRIHSTTEVIKSNTLAVSHNSNELDENKVIDDKTLISEFSCKQCNKSFKKMKSLLIHLKTHSEKPYQCTVCGRCFVQNSHLQRHFMSHKVWPDGLSETTVKSLEIDILSYSCSYCNTVLSNYNQFRAHLKNHIHLKKFKCIQNECVHLFETVDNLIHHVSMCHDPPSYKCHICKKMFNSLDEIAEHHQNHNMDNKNTYMSDNKQYKCSQCDATFKRMENLSLHMLTENHKKMCIYCKKVFASDKRLRLHLQIHNKVKQFQCTMCNSTFHMKKYLTSHMLRHGERQFSCSICKYRFKRRDLLQRHMKSHQLRKIFKCPFRDSLECKMEFNRSDKLKLHIRHHTKQVTLSNKSSKNNDPSTMEICIVPIDEMKIVTDQVYLDIHNEEKPLGRVIIGLFGDLAPKAVNNFKVLTTNGIKGKSYKGTRFNRIIKRFMIQGGDVISDDGTGSISIYGETFEDENLDTQHSMAGFVSMANKGRDSNGCQFLITTTGTPWLDGLHTVIGKVIEGQNVVHMVEHTPTDGQDRPTQRVHIQDCGLLPTPQPFYISDDPYDLWAWIKASTVPLTMSFSILGFFHWMMRKMDI